MAIRAKRTRESVTGLTHHERGEWGQDHGIGHGERGVEEAALDLRAHGAGLFLQHELGLDDHRVDETGRDGGQSNDGQVAGQAPVRAQPQLSAVMVVDVDAVDGGQHGQALAAVPQEEAGREDGQTR